ncbi:MAG: cell envelope integrity protein TolA [Acidiferrobacter sp.]
MVDRNREPLGRFGASLYAVLVHLAVLGFLVLSFRWSALDTSYVLKSNQRVIQAFMVGPLPVPRPPQPALPTPHPQPTPQVPLKPAPQPITHKGPSAAALAKARAQLLAQKKALEEASAKAQAQARKIAKARIEEAAAQKAAAARARLKAEERQAALKARANLNHQIAVAQARAQARARAQAAAQKAARGVVDRYKALIEARVSAAWVAVPNVHGLRCEVAVRVIAGGQVVSVRILHSSGNAVFDRSVVAAIYGAAPLPMPRSPARLRYLRRFHFVFKAPKGY